MMKLNECIELVENEYKIQDDVTVFISKYDIILASDVERYKKETCRTIVFHADDISDMSKLPEKTNTRNDIKYILVDGCCTLYDLRIYLMARDIGEV